MEKDIIVQDLCIFHNENRDSFEKECNSNISSEEEQPIKTIGIESGKFILTMISSVQLPDIIEMSINFFWPIDHYPLDPKKRKKKLFFSLILKKENNYEILDKEELEVVKSLFRECENIDVIIKEKD